MALIKVLLRGGRAAGRIVEVEDTDASVEVSVPGITVVGPNILPTAEPATVKQRYVGTADIGSGYPVWDLSEE